MNLKDIPEVEPDEIDEAMIAEAEKENSEELYELEDLKWIPGYIDKQTALQELEKERLLLLDRRMYGAEHILVRHAIPVIEGISPINVKPVSRGQWINDAFEYLDEDATVHPIWSCSCCGTAFEEFDEKPGWNYCPNCGADMRGDAT